MATFKKGQPVLTIASWNDEGCFYIRRATVYSCGKKQMVLNDRNDSTKCLGRNFRPEVKQEAHFSIVCHDRSTAFAAEALALLMAQKYLAWQIETKRHIVALHRARYGIETDAYIRATEADIANLQTSKPSVLWK